MSGGSRRLHNEGVSKPARVGGPPVQGLYDQPKSPARTSTPLYQGIMHDCYCTRSFNDADRERVMTEF